MEAVGCQMGSCLDARAHPDAAACREHSRRGACTVLDVCATAAYVPTRDWRRVVYWLAAATLTTVVTW